MDRLLKLLRYFRNFYVLTGVLFAVWMIFLDGSNWRMMAGTWYNLQSAKAKKRLYQDKIAEVKKEREEVMGNTQALEKFAREKYLMKKPTEDLYIIEVPKEEK